MATYTPPPYFPQSSLSPPDEKRYRKFKLVVAALVVLLLAIIGGAITGIVYLIKWLAWKVALARLTSKAAHPYSFPFRTTVSEFL